MVAVVCHGTSDLSIYLSLNGMMDRSSYNLTPPLIEIFVFSYVKVTLKLNRRVISNGPQYPLFLLLLSPK